MIKMTLLHLKRIWKKFEANFIMNFHIRLCFILVMFFIFVSNLIVQNMFILFYFYLQNILEQFKKYSNINDIFFNRKNIKDI